MMYTYVSSTRFTSWYVFWEVWMKLKNLGETQREDVQSSAQIVTQGQNWTRHTRDANFTHWPLHVPESFTLKCRTGAVLKCKIIFQLKDPSTTRYEVPFVAMPSNRHTTSQDLLYDVEFQPDPFGFVVRRRSNGRVLWVCSTFFIQALLFIWG